MNNALKKLANQTAIYGLSTIIGRLLNILLVPLYTNIFKADEYGIVTEFFTYIAFFLILLTYGMETGFFRFAQKNKDNFNKVYSSILTSIFSTSSIFIILIFIFLSPLSVLIGYINQSEYIIFSAIIVALDAFMSIPFAKLRLQNKTLKFVTIKLINISLNIVLNIFFLVFCPFILKHFPNTILLKIYSPEIGIGYIFISNLIVNIITLILLLPEIFNIKYQFDIKLLKSIFIYSLPLLIAGFAGMTNETIDRLMLKNLLKATVSENYALSQLGIYQANYKLAILMTLFIQMFRYAAEPFFFENKNEKNAKELYAKATKFFIIFGIGIFLVVVFYLDIFKFFIGKNYHSGLHIVPILLLANLFLGIFFNLSMWYKLNDMTKYGAYLMIIGSIITIVLNFIFIPFFGYTGSAYVTLICYFTMCTLSFFWGQKYYKIPYYLKNALFYFVLAAILYLINIFVVRKFFDSIYIIIPLNTLLLAIYGFIFIKKEKALPIIKLMINFK